MLRSLCIFLGLVASLPAADSNGVPLFNGRDLTGWDGDTAFWSVRDGAITGRTTAAKPTPANTFLIWTGGEIANFELHVTFRIVGDNDTNTANSGVQYRSRVMDAAAWRVGGYQADMDGTGKVTGMLYEEKGRGVLARPGERMKVGPAGSDGKARLEPLSPAADSTEIARALRQGDWNDYVILAEGDRLRHFVNGKLTADVIDLDPAKAAKSGVLALQLHRGPPMTVQFKNIYLRKLP